MALEEFFPGGAASGYFQTFFLEEAKSGEICFFSHSNLRKQPFCLKFQTPGVSKAVLPTPMKKPL